MPAQTPGVPSTQWIVQVPANIGITIMGTGNPSSAPAVVGPDPSCSQTVITLVGPATTNSTAFRMNPSFGNSTSRISCMVIAYGGQRAVSISVLGTCTPSGCPQARWDNLTFNNWQGHVPIQSFAVAVIDNMFGVIDHNALNGNPAVSGFLHLTQFNHGNYLGVGDYGDNAWAQPAGFGSANWLFMENNLFVNAGVGENEGNASGGIGLQFGSQGGGRAVIRFNTFQSMINPQNAITWHGTETSGRPRGGRAWDFYGNVESCPGPIGNCLSVGQMRSGTGLSWGNSVTQPANGTFNNFWTMNTHRMFAKIGGWGACDGTTVFDTNDGLLYFSGTVGAITPSTGNAQGPTITVMGTDPGWITSPPQWAPIGAPYSFHSLTEDNGTEIYNNGSNTLSINSGGGSPGTAWIGRIAVGDSFEIRRATICMDAGGGRGAGFLFMNTDPMTPDQPANQVAEPAYFWMNTFSIGTPQSNVVGYRTLRVVGGRDWFTETLNQSAQTSPTSPFDGTVPPIASGSGGVNNGSGGVGHGTLANRPTTCSTGPNGAPGAAYFATDQGSWNTSGNAFGQGQLYVCTATNTWTLYYTPYTYPHPLVH
jgi:hypothetical protein